MGVGVGGEVEAGCAQKPARPSTQKRELPESSRKIPAEPEVEATRKISRKAPEGFAGDALEDFAVDDLFDEDFADEDFSGDIDSEKWRIETRTYTKQDGTIMLYYNYRRRTYAVKENGKKYYPYKKGGKRVIGHE